MGSRNRQVRYVYDIPYGKRRQLCQTLDVNSDWKRLAEQIDISPVQIGLIGNAILRPGGSPTDELLTLWSHSNATVMDLFHVLQNLRFFRQMDVIRDYIPQAVYDQALRDGGLLQENNHPPSYTEVSLQMRGQGRPGPSQPVPVVRPPVSQGLCHPRAQPPHAAAVDQDGLPLPPLPPRLAAPRDGTTAQKTPLTGQRVPYVGPPHMTPQRLPAQAAGRPGFSRPPPGPVESIDDHCDSSLEEQHWRTQEAGRSYGRMQPVEDEAPHPSLSMLKEFDFKEIRAATHGFHRDRMLGEGGFGHVYKGVLHKTNFAIKKLHREFSIDGKSKGPDPLAEVKALIKYKHENIIPLIGYSLQEGVLCLVYQYMANGSLQDRLSRRCERPPLNWYQRQIVLVGATRALQYLHDMTPKPLIHGDIKSANILLDAHLEAKLCDFGLAHEATGGSAAGKYTHVSRDQQNSRVYGSRAYLPADFFQEGCRISVHVDKYSFGIVFFETCTGEPAYDENREGGAKLKQYLGQVFGSLSERAADEIRQQKMLQFRDAACSDWPAAAWLRVMAIGRSLTSEEPVDRPPLADVLEDLERLKEEVDNLLRQNYGEGSLVSLRSGLSSSPRSTNFSFLSQGQGHSLHDMQSKAKVHGIETSFGKIRIHSQGKESNQAKVQFVPPQQHQRPNSGQDAIQTHSFASDPEKLAQLRGEEEMFQYGGKAQEPSYVQASDPRSGDKPPPYQLQKMFDERNTKQTGGSHPYEGGKTEEEEDIYGSDAVYGNEHLYMNASPHNFTGLPDQGMDLREDSPLNPGDPAVYANMAGGQVDRMRAPMKQETEVSQNNVNIVRENLVGAGHSQPRVFMPVTPYEEVDQASPCTFRWTHNRSGAHIDPSRQHTGEQEVTCDCHCDLDHDLTKQNSPLLTGDSLDALREKGLPSFMNFQEEEEELEEIINLQTGQAEEASGASWSQLLNADAVRLCSRFPDEKLGHMTPMSPQLYDEIQQNLSQAERCRAGPPTPTRSTPATPTHTRPIYSTPTVESM